MIIDYLQKELEKYEKRIQHEEKTYGELLWTRQKNLEDMKVGTIRTVLFNRSKTASLKSG